MLKNYFEESEYKENDLNLLPPEVRSADNLEQTVQMARDWVDIKMQNRGYKENIEGWDDDAKNVSDESLVRAVKWSIAYKTADLIFENTDIRVKTKQIGPKRVSFDQNKERDIFKFVKPYVDNEPIWSLR